MTIFSNFSDYKNQVALILDNNEKITYQGLIDSTDKFARNFDKRCLVFLVVSNSFSCIIAYIGLVKAGCAIALIDENINYKSLTNLISLYQPSYIFLPNEKKIDNKEYTLVNNFSGYSLLGCKDYLKNKINDKLFLLIPTSGSTGSPKFVRQSYLNLDSNTESIMDFLKVTHNDKAISTLPMNYVYGLSVINTHLEAGGTLCLNNYSVVNRVFWEKLEINEITNFAGVPYTYKILDKLDFYKYDLKKLNYTTHAGGKIDEALMKKIVSDYKKKNRKFISMYGSTEATARMSYLPWKHVEEKLGSIGIPIPKGKLSIIDSNNKEISKSNTIGEIVYEGPNVSMGYANNINDLSKDDENKCYLKTGDLGYKDKENFIFVTGRKNRITKVFGIRVDLDNLELLILNEGFKAICKAELENKVSVYIDNKKYIKLLTEKLKLITSLHPSAFNFKITTKTEKEIKQYG